MAAYYDFAGQKIIRPGAYTKRNFPSEQGLGNLTGQALILGEAAKGGVPYSAFDEIEDVVNVVSGQAEALNAFGGGTLYYGAEFFLTPTNDSRFNSPSEAKCIVVNQMTQAELILGDIKIKALKFGTDGNQIGFRITDGSVSGKRLEIMQGGDKLLDSDNVSLPLLSLSYELQNGETEATVSIADGVFSTSIAGGTGFSINLSEFADLGSLVNFINSKPGYTCLLEGASDEKVLVFDDVSKVDIANKAVSLGGLVEALIRAINATEVVTAELISTGRGDVANVADYLHLAGGSVSAATTEDWINVLAKLEKYDTNFLVVMSGSETIHQLVKTHIEKMNGMAVKKYRQAVTGAGAAVNTVKLRIAEMKALGSAYLEYCVSSFSRFDYVKKQVTNFEPFYLAAMVAGLRAANNVGMDIVFKYLNVLSTPEIELADQNKYGAAGATFIQKTNNVLDGSRNFEILMNNTTYQGSQVTRTNPACVYEINVLTKYIEEYVIEQVRALDKVANSVVVATIQNKLTSYLFPKIRDDLKWITDYTDETTGKTQAAFSDVSFKQEGEKFYISGLFTMSVTPRFVFNMLTFIVAGQYV